MGGWKGVCALLLVAFLGAGCNAPSSSPASGATEPTAQPSAAAQGAASSSSDWQQIVDAANKEGGLNISGPPTSDIQDAMTQGFEAQYPGIKIDYTAEAGGEVVPRVMPQRQSGQYLEDMVVNGTTTLLTLMKADALDPVQPYLVGPDDQDPSKWLGGQLSYADTAATYNLMFGGIVKTPLATNPSLVPAGSITSYQDLLDPKWKGQIAMYDPRSAGASLATVTYFYTTPGLGTDYLNKLFAQDIKLSRDDSQILNWVVQGESAIAIAPSEKYAAEFVQKGIPLNMMGGDQIKEGSYLTAGVASLGILNNTPHPNALKVYLNWFLNQPAQLAFAKAAGYASYRTDVPTDFLPGYLVPQPGVDYQQNASQAYVDLKDQILNYLNATIQ